MEPMKEEFFSRHLKAFNQAVNTFVEYICTFIHCNRSPGVFTRMKAKMSVLVVEQRALSNIKNLKSGELFLSGLSIKQG